MMSSWQELQNSAHGPDHEYEPGSPHLAHPALNARVAGEIRAAIDRSFDRSGGCHVLEIGAGHGTFTEVAVAAGASVTVTEMSASSVATLNERFRHNDRVQVIHDAEGDGVLSTGSRYDVVLCISVLHHIPDYLGYVKGLLDVVSPGGDLISFQDPLWYPRRSRLNLAAYWSCYFAWRVFRGDLVRGVRTRVRHLRGALDERLESDMVEYHVVRQGVDEVALEEIVKDEFASTTVVPYWSTQSPALQRLGERLDLHSTFALLATGRAGTEN
jgi:SAM-dependent methyltransferase